jgi:hypothetical protein
LGPYITLYFLGFCFSAVGYSAKKIKNWELGQKKKSIWIAYVHLFGLKDFLEF